MYHALDEKIPRKLFSGSSAFTFQAFNPDSHCVARVFPNDDSAYRLIGAVLADINDAWSERIYLNFGGLWDADLVAIDSDLISVAVA